MVTQAKQAETILRDGAADLVALAREMLFNPNWPLHAAQELGVDPGFALWPKQFGIWLKGRERQRAPGRTASDQ